LKQQRQAASPSRNNCRPSKPLVDYEDEDDAMEGIAASNNDIISNTISSSGVPNQPQTLKFRHAASISASPSPLSTEATIPTPERLAEKRRRTELEDDDDELGKLSLKCSKKRTSPPTSDGKLVGGLQRKRSGVSLSSGGWKGEGGNEPAKKKIAISLNAGKTGTGVGAATTFNTTDTVATISPEKAVKRALKAVEGEEVVEAADGQGLENDDAAVGDTESNKSQVTAPLSPSSGTDTEDGGGGGSSNGGGGGEVDGNTD